MPPIESFLSPGLQFGLKNGNPTCWIICGVLALLSITSWAVLLSKHLLLSRVHRANMSFLREGRESSHPRDLVQRRERHEFTWSLHLYQAASRAIAWDRPAEQ